MLVYVLHIFNALIKNTLEILHEKNKTGLWSWTNVLGSLKTAVYTANLDVWSITCTGHPLCNELIRIFFFFDMDIFRMTPFSLTSRWHMYLDLKWPSLSSHSICQVLENPTHIYFLVSVFHKWWTDIITAFVSFCYMLYNIQHTLGSQ